MTAQKKTKNDNLFLAATETIPDGVIITDADGEIIYCNAGAALIFGYAKEEMLGRSAGLLVPEQQKNDNDKTIEKIRSADTGDHPGKTVEYNGLRKDGTHVPLESSFSSLKIGDELFFVGIHRDITKKKRAEKALRKTEERLSNMADAIHEGLIIAKNGKVVYVNDRLCEITGYSKQELTALPSREIAAPEEREKIRHLMEKYRTTGEITNEAEYWITRKDGTRKFIRNSYSTTGKEGARDFYVVVSDMTEHKEIEHSLKHYNERLKAREQELRATNQQLTASEQQLIAANQQLIAGAQELRESKEFLENIFETTADGIILVDNTGSITRVNRAAAEMLGYADEDLLGKYTFELSPRDEEHQQKNLAMIETLFEQGCVKNWESQWYRKDGSLIWTEINITMLHNDQGDHIGSVSTVRDITARKHSDEELTRLATAVDQADEMIAVSDSNGYLLYVNPAFERLTGYSKEELLGQNAASLNREGAGANADFKMDVLLNITDGTIWKGRLKQARKDGSFLDLETSITPIKSATGEIINYVSVQRDVTKEIRMQEQLRQAQKMEAIGTLAGGIAHDFNNILGAIIGYTELSLDTVQATGNGHSHMSCVLKSANRAKELVQQILAFSRRSEKAKKPLALIPILKETLKFLRASLPATIEIRQRIETDQDIIMADFTEIHQVFMNLCTNAGHAMKERTGVLEVVLSALDSGSEIEGVPLGPGPYLTLAVTDSGHGIPREILGRIFEPYFTTKDKGEGTGLGLAVVHGIVKDHGGEIAVYSEEGQGTTFYVYLPMIKHDGGVLHDTEPALIPGGNEHVLLVDDEKDLVDIAQKTLEVLGYRVTARISPVDALEAFKSKYDTIDIVITDKTMPNMTGFELARELRKIKRDIPIILCTGFSAPEDLEQTNACGINEVIMKPLVKKQMARSIRNALDKKES